MRRATDLIALVTIAALASCHDREGAGEDGAAPPAVSSLGPSWLTHLGLDTSTTHLGRAGGGSQIAVPPIEEPKPSKVSSRPFVVGGADVYRWSCRSCHGPAGLGAPPEIGSLIGAVQATSPASLKQRMKQSGRQVSDKLVNDLAADATRSLEQRIARGGEKMPPFGYLDAAERRALRQYLEGMARVPGSEAPPSRLELSADRVGELVARGTCHICHDARGPGDRHSMMMRGITPSLESLTSRPFRLFLDKVQHGAVGGGGMGGMMGRQQRMPPYPYLTASEIAAIYRYLHR